MCYPIPTYKRSPRPSPPLPYGWWRTEKTPHHSFHILTLSPLHEALKSHACSVRIFPHPINSTAQIIFSAPKSVLRPPRAQKKRGGGRTRILLHARLSRGAKPALPSSAVRPAEYLQTKSRVGKETPHGSGPLLFLQPPFSRLRSELCCAIGTCRSWPPSPEFFVPGCCS